MNRRKPRAAPAAGCLTCVAASWFLFFWAVAGFGWHLAWQQYEKVSLYRPVLATVLSSRIDFDTNGHTPNYIPRIRYRYLVRGRTYVAGDVYPVQLGSGRAAAQAVLDRFPVGQRCTAYYDPRDPSRAFLERRIAGGPYFFAVVSMVLVLAGAFCMGSPRLHGRIAARTALRPWARWMALAAGLAALLTAGDFMILAACYNRSPAKPTGEPPVSTPPDPHRTYGRARRSALLLRDHSGRRSTTKSSSA